MIWNYCVFREADGGLTIREVFYARDGNIIACSEPVQLEAESITDLTRLIEELKAALDLPILSLADVPLPSVQPSPRADRRNTLTHQAVLARLGLTPEPR